MKLLTTTISVLLLLLTLSDANAKIKEIIVGVDGFTCSLCAKGVEGQFKDLDFVESVTTHLKETRFTLILKDNAKVDFNEIREAVTDGGFTLREIIVDGEGTITLGPDDVVSVKTGNSPDIELHGYKEEFEMDETVSFKGKMSKDTKSVTVSEIRKM